MEEKQETKRTYGTKKKLFYQLEVWRTSKQPKSIEFRSTWEL